MAVTGGIPEASPAHEAVDVEPVGPLAWLGRGIAHVVEQASLAPNNVIVVNDVDYGDRPLIEVTTGRSGTHVCVRLADRHLTVLAVLPLEVDR